MKGQSVSLPRPSAEDEADIEAIKTSIERLKDEIKEAEETVTEDCEPQNEAEEEAKN